MGQDRKEGEEVEVANKGLTRFELNPYFYFSGWETRIRTWVDGVRVRSPAAGRSPIKFIYYTQKLKGRQ